MRKFVCLLPLAFLLYGCGNDEPAEQEQEVVQEVLPPPVDSLQLQVLEYERELAAAREDVSQRIWQLNRLSDQLNDSIEHTQVPPQLQEETIRSYQNQLEEVRQVKLVLQQWQEQASAPLDSLSNAEKKVYLQKQLQRLEGLRQETRQVRREAQETMEASDQEAY